MEAHCTDFLTRAYLNRKTKAEKLSLLNTCSHPLWIYWFIAKTMFTALTVDALNLPYNSVYPDRAVFNCVCEKLIEANELSLEDKQKADAQIEEVNKLSLDLICAGRLVRW